MVLDDLPTVSPNDTDFGPILNALKLGTNMEVYKKGTFQSVSMRKSKQEAGPIYGRGREHAVMRFCRQAQLLAKKSSRFLAGRIKHCILRMQNRILFSQFLQAVLVEYLIGKNKVGLN